jgi:hypothetical protein
MTEEVQKGMMEEFDRLREGGRKVSNATMVRVLRSLTGDKLVNTAPSLLTSRVHRWFLKNHLSLRRITHCAQNTRYVNMVTRDWQEYVQGQERTFNFSPDDMVNIDETNIDFDVKSGETYEHAGVRNVPLVTTASSMRCTVLLGVTKSGIKLKPLVIFKGKPGGRIHREWDNPTPGNEYPDDCLYMVQAKAWVDKAIFDDWISLIWTEFAAQRPQSYLIMDQFKVHMMGEFIKRIQQCGSEVDFVPAGYTGRLQVLDVSVNKPFKDHMRAEYETWMAIPNIEEGFHPKKVSRLLVARWISSAWANITVLSITNGWRRCVDVLQEVEEEAMTEVEAETTEVEDDEEDDDVE